MPLTLKAASDDNGRRLDRILRKALPQMPLSAIHRLLRKGLVLVDGKKAAPGRLVQEGETITVNIQTEGGESRPAGEKRPPSPREGRDKPEPRKPEIIFEGAGIIALNKPAGIAVHGKDSFEDDVLRLLKPRLPPSLSFRPGPLHRLDKPSSGLIVFSASLEGARLFSALLRERKIRKFYLALVEGNIEKPEIWRDELSRDKNLQKTFAARTPGKEGEPPRAGESRARTAVTRVEPLAGSAGATLILAEIETGRTHQIRAQAAAHGHPLFGDTKYGGTPFGSGGAARGGFLLHAWRVEFPPGYGFPPRLEAPLPAYFSEKIRSLFGDKAAATSIFRDSPA